LALVIWALFLGPKETLRDSQRSGADCTDWFWDHEEHQAMWVLVNSKAQGFVDSRFCEF